MRDVRNGLRPVRFEPKGELVTLNRRDLLMAGGGFTGASLAVFAQASAAPVPVGRSVTDFGVSPDVASDQTQALQKAIEQISGAGETVYIPGGAYRVNRLELPQRCALEGAPGLTRFVNASEAAMLDAPADATLSLSGLILEGGIEAAKGLQCTIHAVVFLGVKGSAVKAGAARSALISQCRFKDCASAGVDIVAEEGALIGGNQFSGCAIAVRLGGVGNITGNLITGSPQFGLRLGGGSSSGAISATSNTIRECGVAIGVTIFAALNLITAARNGAIRAFDGDRLLGPDLAFESAESYLNLNVVGNVAR